MITSILDVTLNPVSITITVPRSPATLKILDECLASHHPLQLSPAQPTDDDLISATRFLSSPPTHPDQGYITAIGHLETLTGHASHLPLCIECGVYMSPIESNSDRCEGCSLATSTQ